MWDEYVIPAMFGCFIVGVIVGLNIGIMCVPNLFERRTGYESNITERRSGVLRFPQESYTPQLGTKDFVRGNQIIGNRYGVRNTNNILPSHTQRYNRGSMNFLN